MTKNIYRVTVLKTAEDRERYGHGYKYLIRYGVLNSYTAFRTDTGMKEFLKRNKMTMVKDPVWGHDYILSKTIEERLFCNLSQIENIENCISYYNLSNGSLVTCYSEILEDKVINYRPNPNAKNVYRPLPIDAHIEYMKIYG